MMRFELTPWRTLASGAFLLAALLLVGCGSGETDSAVDAEEPAALDADAGPDSEDTGDVDPAEGVDRPLNSSQNIDGLAACDDPVRIDVASAFDDALLNLAIVDGHLAAECLDVKIRTGVSASGIVDRISEGTLDLALMAPSTAGLLVANQTAPIRILGVREVAAGENDPVALIAGPRSEIEDLSRSQLQGKTVGVTNPASFCTLVTKQVLLNAGIEDFDNDIALVETLSAGDLRARIASGEIDFGCVARALAQPLVDDDASILGGAVSAWGDDVPVAVTVANDAFVDATAGLVSRWNTALSSAAEWANEDEARYRGRLVELLDLDSNEIVDWQLPLIVGGASPVNIEFEPIWATLRDLELVDDGSYHERIFG